MKEKYIKPQSQIDKFDTEDVVTTSNTGGSTGGLTPSGWIDKWY